MKVAVTGGIGVGKSEVMRIIAGLGYRTASADEINARLLQRPDYIARLASVFPSAVRDGKIDKYELRKIIFGDYEKRQLLNSIAHPLIFAEIKKVEGDVFVEVPLLFECGMQKLFDKIVVVTAPYEIRLSRLFDRSGIDRKLAAKMVSSQLSDSERISHADYVLENISSKDDLYVKVRELITKLENE
jgi:dephospho-CoA kinase